MHTHAHIRTHTHTHSHALSRTLTHTRTPQVHPSMARELFAAGFVSCWSELDEHLQHQLVRRWVSMKCTHTYAWSDTHTHMHTNTHTYTRTHTHTHAHTHTHTHSHTHSHTLSHAHTHIHTHTHARTHARTHTHTHTSTCTHGTDKHASVPLLLTTSPPGLPTYSPVNDEWLNTAAS